MQLLAKRLWSSLGLCGGLLLLRVQLIEVLHLRVHRVLSVRLGMLGRPCGEFGGRVATVRVETVHGLGGYVQRVFRRLLRPVLDGVVVVVHLFILGAIGVRVTVYPNGRVIHHEFT
ncbi:hypothetical protein GGR56DRAFT_644948 [Xylariaceae sp. FL0804]|nr:hypothetical protein GGR56DRAFT_644948 [Xylariaceae sp. FL0804]